MLAKFGLFLFLFLYYENYMLGVHLFCFLQVQMTVMIESRHCETQVYAAHKEYWQRQQKMLFFLNSGVYIFFLLNW